MCESEKSIGAEQQHRLKEKNSHSCLHVRLSRCAARHVALLWEEQQIIWHVASHKRRDEAHCVPRMHIFINHPVHEQQPPRDAVRVSEHAARLVAIWVARGSAHVALRVAAGRAHG